MIFTIMCQARLAVRHHWGGGESACSSSLSMYSSSSFVALPTSIFGGGLWASSTTPARYVTSLNICHSY